MAKIIERSYGKDVIIPETKNNSRFVYTLRNVRKLNDDCKEEQELINELEPRQQKAERKLILLAWSLENTLKGFTKGTDYHKWEDHNRADFNEYYHDQISKLTREIDGYCIEYANRSQHGWCM